MISRVEASIWQRSWNSTWPEIVTDLPVLQATTANERLTGIVAAFLDRGRIILCVPYIMYAHSVPTTLDKYALQ